MAFAVSFLLLGERTVNETVIPESHQLRWCDYQANPFGLFGNLLRHR